jgi:hypothetical protein
MKLYLDRHTFYGDCTIGRLITEGSAYTCDTLEPAIYDGPRNGGGRAPFGTYNVVIRGTENHDIADNRHNLHQVLEFYNVPPNRTDMLIHIGNYPRNTHGCILVGKWDGGSSLRGLSSRPALEAIMDIIRANPGAWEIKITDPHPWNNNNPAPAPATGTGTAPVTPPPPAYDPFNTDGYVGDPWANPNRGPGITCNCQ